MKSIIKITAFAACLLLVIASQSCRKPHKPQEPCDNPSVVTALDPSYYYHAHFSVADQQNVIHWLYATNWNQYAGKVTPGMNYKMSYREVSCSDGNCETYNGIREGGCTVLQRKCVVITCLEEIKQAPCLRSEITDIWTKEMPRNIVSATGIVGDKLSAEITFSGCSEEDYKRFKLSLLELSTANAMGSNVFIAKAVDTNQGVTCMAEFTHKCCFDLSAIKSYYTQANRPVPQSVIVRVYVNNGTTVDLTYIP